MRFDAGTRGAYSTDGSNFRQVPIGVVIPRTHRGRCRRCRGLPRARRACAVAGGGTSLAGQCTNAAVMIDWAKYCHRLVSVDVDARTCVVEPGIVLDVLNKQLEQHGLRYGPEPATHPNCTLGGMIGNNSCGATAQRTGKVVDNIARLEVLLYDGTRFWCGETDDDEYVAIERRGDRQAHVYRQLRALRDEYADDIRAGFPDIPRRVSGYNLDSLLPEKNFDVAGLLVGSESTLITVLQAELELVPVVKERSLVVLGYRTIMDAADAVPRDPAARTDRARGTRSPADPRPADQGYERGRARRAAAGRRLPHGAVRRRDAARGRRARVPRCSQRSARTSRTRTSRSSTNPSTRTSCGRCARPASARPHTSRTSRTPGRAGRTPPCIRTGWATTCATWRSCTSDFGYADDSAPSLYGHFGQGCVHTRIPFGLTDADGVAKYRRFLESAADLVASYGGSLSGEHGDGQTRGELLPRMFGARIMQAFGELKAIFDPDDRMNPGKVVSPAPLDSHLRLGATWAPRIDGPLHFSYPEDDGSFVKAATRCVGVGKCRQHAHDGRRRDVPVVPGDARGGALHARPFAAAVRDAAGHAGFADQGRLALDGGARRARPVPRLQGLQVATARSTSTWRRTRRSSSRTTTQGRLRPRSHYAMGWLPVFARLVHAARLPRIINAAQPGAGATDPRDACGRAREPRNPFVRGRNAAAVVGDAAAARNPVCAEPSSSGRTRSRTTSIRTSAAPRSRCSRTRAGRCASRPNRSAAASRGSRPASSTPPSTSCAARSTCSPITSAPADSCVGLEPSCTAVFRSDAADLMPDDLDVAGCATRR